MFYTINFTTNWYLYGETKTIIAIVISTTMCNSEHSPINKFCQINRIVMLCKKLVKTLA